MIVEEWRPVLDWQDLYEVSDLGRVRSLKRRKGTQGGLLLKTPLGNTGYQQLNLCRGGKPLHTFVHYLVAEAFHGPRPPGMECRHLDGQKVNNRADNLAWGTSRENNLDQVRHGTWRNKHTGTTCCKHGHEFTEENTRWVVRPDGSKWRQCIACRKRRAGEQNERKKAARLARWIAEGRWVP